VCVGFWTHHLAAHQLRAIQNVCYHMPRVEISAAFSNKQKESWPMWLLSDPLKYQLSSPHEF
jgi:hypothetical protein